MSKKHRMLIIIVIAQFCCTSLWFANNAIIGDLALYFNLPESAMAYLTSFVQLGFIFGTLIFALLSIADRYSPSRVFLICAVLGCLVNLATLWSSNDLRSLLLLRFATGFFLAGIYPVGMKIAADHFEKGLGKSLGFLVGALVIGTAFPHLIRSANSTLPWKYVIFSTSTLAMIGGLMIYVLVPDGPYRKRSKRLNLTAGLTLFREKEFRAAAFGYFGHMWELYTFWAFVPLLLTFFLRSNTDITLQHSFVSFIVIGVGGIACAIGGWTSSITGTKVVAYISLLISCVCCIVSPFVLQAANLPLFVTFMIIWGMFVVSDSPMFSSIIADVTIPELRGTALTLVNCVGFAITIVSIQALQWISEQTDSVFIFTSLAIGPVLGLFFFKQSNSLTESIS